LSKKYTQIIIITHQGQEHLGDWLIQVCEKLFHR